MFDVIRARIKQGQRTISFPAGEPVLPELFRGAPQIDQALCPAQCQDCVRICPTGALRKESGRLEMDLGRCLFCTECTQACSSKAISLSRDHRLSVRNRADLLTKGEGLRLAEALDKKMRSIFGRSLKLRQVSAGGCNACEADVNVLSTVVFDLGRFGIQFVASPRHADGLLITGPVTENMRQALLETYHAVPEPRLVIAVGSCAISGGLFAGNAEVRNGADGLVPVDLFIPGCPPHPLTTLDGLLRLLGRI